MSDSDRLSCQDAFARLDDFVDRELSATELERLEAHLQDCACCAPHFEFEQQVLDGVRRQIRRIRAPVGLLDGILSRLRAK
ncbi:MAG: zf-HC2 domain-containing protein [Gemmatimonadota bacterium]|nr:zf-HC2 domain-containing protein [Gemmatimonadota bacterium]